MKKAFICLIVVLTFFSYAKVYALENIRVDNYELSPRFDKNTHKYNVFVGSSIKEITINAIPSENEEIVSGNGTFEIKKDSEIFVIEVKDSSQNIKKYEINVYKDYKKINNKSSSKLIDLQIKGYEIDFDPNVLNYTINIDNEEYLEIYYEAESDNAKVILTGNENLNYGSNEILITVFSQDEKQKTIYSVNVNKLKDVFHNTSNSKTDNVTMRANQRNFLKVIICLVALFTEIIFYKILFSKKKN